MIRFKALTLPAALIATCWLSACTQEPPTATPLAAFEAPFVFGHFNLPADNPLTQEGVALGRRLFYDPKLSGNNAVTCATCHRQALAFSDGKRTAVGISGRPLAFNSMTLANLLWGPPRFFWDGRASSLEALALMPIAHADEMGQDLGELVEELAADARYRALFAAAYGDITPAHIGAALASFLRTLVSSNSRYDQYLRGDQGLTEQEELGRKLFMAHPDTKASTRGGNCIDCHSQFLTGGFATRFDGFSNNGLDADHDLPPGLMAVTGRPEHRGLFKVPSLRNIAVTAPYMHDGRFDTLAEVLHHYNSGIQHSSTLSPLIIEASNQDASEPTHNLSLSLTMAEQQAIIAFLHTLTDEEFLANPQHSNPFNNDAVPDAKALP